MWVKNTNDSASRQQSNINIYQHQQKPGGKTDDDNDDKWHPTIANMKGKKIGSEWFGPIKCVTGKKNKQNQKKCPKFFRSSMVNFAFIVITLIYFLISLSLRRSSFVADFCVQPDKCMAELRLRVPTTTILNPPKWYIMYCFCIAWLQILVFIHKIFTRHLQIVSSFGQHTHTAAQQNDMNGFTFIAMTDQKNCTVERYSRILFAQTYL